MRFMMLMIPKGYEDAAPGAMPTAEAVAAMMKYNHELKTVEVRQVQEFDDFPPDVQQAIQ